MADTPSRRLAPQVIEADIEAVLALKGIPDYQSFNPAYALDALLAAHTSLRDAEESEVHAYNAYAAARDATVARQWKLHHLILGVKNQMKAQFGTDSDQVAALGLKKQSERKRPAKARKSDS